MKVNLLKKSQQFLVASSLCFVVIFFPLKSEALTILDVPNPRQVDSGWVTDLAEILADSTEAQLNQMIEQLEAKNGTEVAVVTVPETSPAASPKEFTTELFNYWEIGKKEQDNGVLFLISVGERRVEIETGYGIEGILPDAKVGRIIDTQIKPRFKQGDFDGGTLAGTKALVVALEGESSLPIREKLPRHWVLLVVGSILALGIRNAICMSRRVFIQPNGNSRFRGGNRILLCANCHKRMQQVDGKVLESYLSKPQKVAQTMGSVSFEAWKCPNCAQQLKEDDFHLVAYESSDSRFRKCPNCDELTVVTYIKSILKPATRSSEGTRLVIGECYCCEYRQEKQEIIPRLSSSSSSWIISGGSSSGGGFGSGSGGGSFGGGSSGGGGAGGDW